MSQNTRFRKALKKTTIPQTGWLDVFDAVIGKIDGTITTGVPGEIYVRNILNGQPLRVHNASVENKLNLQVEVGRRVDEPNKWQVKCERNSFAAPAGMGFIPFHFPQHVFPAADSGLFPRKQIRELSVIVADGAGFLVQVYGGAPRTASGIALINNQQVDLSSYVPTVGAVYVNIETDDTGTLSVNAGTAFAAVGLGTAADVPVPDAGKYRLATVLLIEGMTALLDEHIYVPFPLEPDYAGLAAVVEDAINNGVTDKAPSENAVYDALALKIPTSYLDTDGTLAANSDTKIATQKATKIYADAAKTSAISTAEAYADSLVVGLWDDRGSFDASGGAYPSSGGSGASGAILKGDIWTISVAGTLPTGQIVEVGDVVRAIVDTPGNTQANWAITQNNIGYVAENSANKDTDGTLAANSDTKYASQKATKTYADSISSNASVIAKVLTGFSAGAGTVSATDTILQAFQKVVGNIALKLTANSPITGAIKTKITYDANGLVTAGTDATTADIADSTNKRYVTDAELTVLGNTSGVNTGDQTIALTGDVTGSGTGSFAATIGNDKVTYAKMQNMATNTILGNPTGGAADPAEISVAPDTTWVPTFTNLSIGNGVLTTGFIKIGKLVIGHLELVFGTTTSISGNVTFTPPVNQGSYGAVSAPIGLCRYLSAGGGYLGTLLALTTSSFRLTVVNASATHAQNDALSATVPATWTTNDVIECQFMYFAS